MTESPKLRILLLGSPAVFAGEQPLQIQRRLLRWMLFYLACKDELVGRAEIILQFWPDEPEEDARRHLRETLSKLRAQLPDPEIIITEQDRIGLDPQRAYTDVREFQSLFVQTVRACAQTPASTPLTQAVHERVVQAVRLWRAAAFMAGARLPESESLNNWMLLTSQQLENQRARLLDRLVDHAAASGDIESAIQWLQKALEGDETNESLHYRLLSLLHTQDRYSEALNYCQYLQELFRREGYDELPPALLSLSGQIREEAAQPSEPNRTAWPSLAGMQVPFVGREDLLQELSRAARRGSPVMLFGEAGSGKSRLVRELFFSLKPVPRLLLAPARIQEASMPYQPMIDMLRHDIRTEEWKSLDLAWITPLALLLPELRIAFPDIQPLRVPPEQERSLIFEALRQLFLMLGKKQRYLLFLDNAQWSDEETLAALAYLAERGLSGENGVLIMAARAEVPSPHLQTFLNRPRSGYSLQRLSLPPLNTEEISTLARYVLGDTFSTDIVPRLERETGGNPLFLLETLRLVLDYSLTAPRAAGSRLPLAVTVHTVIRERLQHLTPYDAQVLNIAAVIGSQFSMDLLESTSMLLPEQIAQSLESLAQANLIRAGQQDRPSGAYIFTHEKVQEVVLLDLSPARKRLFHLRIARALDQKEQGHSAEVEGLLALHFAEAGELESAFQHWLHASLYAWRAYDKEQALNALKNAGDILQRLGGQATDISIYQLYRQWGRLAFDISDPEMMEQAFEMLLYFGKVRQNSLLTGSAYNGLAQLAEMRLQPEKGLALLDQAAPFLEQTGKLFERIEARNHRGVFMLMTGKIHEAQSIFDEALVIAERANDAQSLEARAHTAYWLGTLLLASGWPLLALEMAGRSARDSEEAFYPNGSLRAAILKSAIRRYAGQRQESLNAAQEQLSQSVTQNFPLLAGELHGSAARASFLLGDLDSCWSHLQLARETAQNYPFSNLKESTDCLTGELYRFFGNLEESAKWHLIGSQTGFKNIDALDNNIYLARLIDDIPQAVDKIEGCIGYALRNGLMLYHLKAQVMKAEILIRTGHSDEEIRQIVAFATAESRQRGIPEIEILAQLVNVRMSIAQEQYKEAAYSAQQAASAAVNLHSLPLEIEARRLELAAVRMGQIPAEQAGGGGLQERLAELLSGAKTAQVRVLLEKLIESVDKIP